ncbi:hypothetical protein B0H13DRAFT_1851041 [Mycena leptocephala]|nr:hypothetical protein B0H13DRAFT_1851041 [Mycena leptocephala]
MEEIHSKEPATSKLALHRGDVRLQSGRAAACIHVVPPQILGRWDMLFFTRPGPRQEAGGSLISHTVNTRDEGAVSVRVMFGERELPTLLNRTDDCTASEIMESCKAPGAMTKGPTGNLKRRVA